MQPRQPNAQPCVLQSQLSAKERREVKDGAHERCTVALGKGEQGHVGDFDYNRTHSPKWSERGGAPGDFLLDPRRGDLIESEPNQFYCRGSIGRLLQRTATGCHAGSARSSVGKRGNWESARRNKSYTRLVALLSLQGCTFAVSARMSRYDLALGQINSSISDCYLQQAWRSSWESKYIASQLTIEEMRQGCCYARMSLC